MNVTRTACDFLAKKSFKSKIFKNLVVPQNAVCTVRFDIVYYNKKPVMYKFDNDFEEIFT